MSIENINFQSGLKTLGLNNNDSKVSGNGDIIQPFDSFFKSYLDIVNEANNYQVNAEKIQVDLAAGRTDDILAVTLAQQKAEASLNFTVQVTNKVIEAYKEIMRIQI